MKNKRKHTKSESLPFNPKYKVGQRVWHVADTHGDPGYVVMGVSVPKFKSEFKYMLHRWPNGASRTCLELELTATEPKLFPPIVPKFKVGQRVWHIRAAAGAVGYKVMTIATTPGDADYEYTLQCWPNGYSATLTEKKLTATEPKLPKYQPFTTFIVPEATSQDTTSDKAKVLQLLSNLTLMRAELTTSRAKLDTFIENNKALRLERDKAYAAQGNTHDRIDELMEKTKRLQGIVDAFVEGKI